MFLASLTTSFLFHFSVAYTKQLVHLHTDLEIAKHLGIQTFIILVQVYKFL